MALNGARPTDAVIDQIAGVVDKIRANPESISRRLIVSAWNPGEILDKMALAPCHCLLPVLRRNNWAVDNLFVFNKKYQRSADVFVGFIGALSCETFVAASSITRDFYVREFLKT